MSANANDPLTTTTAPPLSDRSGVTDTVRAQLLASEHWSLLATRSMLWNEAFSRASMFITVLSAALVALALVAQATAFGPGFRLFGLLVLPIVLLLGLATVIRLEDTVTEDYGLVIGMNRLRHAYLELAPELEPYFVAAHHDDAVGVTASFGFGAGYGIVRLLAGTPTVVAAINVVVVGVLAALIAQVAGASEAIVVAVGVVTALTAVIGLGALASRAIARKRQLYPPRFPS
ncbi:MAG TPA: hypothetical protein VF510_13490 [Ktedonobacterales bacterium]